MAVARLSVSPPAPSHVAPSNLSDEVELYQRTYSTLLRSSGETRLRVLESSHMAMGSSLHPLADSDEIDLGAFIYAVRRLPDSIVAHQDRRHGPGGGALPARRHRPARAVGGRRGAGAAAALVRQRRRGARRAAGLGVRRRRPRADARRLPDRVEQDPPAHAAPPAGRPPTASRPRRARPRSAARPTTGRGWPTPGASSSRRGCRRSPTRASRCACGCSAAPRSATSA